MGSFSFQLHSVSPVQEEWYTLEREPHMARNSSLEVCMLHINIYTYIHTYIHTYIIYWKGSSI